MFLMISGNLDLVISSLGLVCDFDFIDMREAAEIVNWNNVPIIDLSLHSNDK